MDYRVDNVPWYWRPLWLGCSWVAGISLWLFFLFLNLTCRIHMEGTENLRGRSSFIYSCWHRSLLLYFVVFVRSCRGQIWINHPTADMKPIHIVINLMKARIILGSGGQEGREAADRLAECLKQGSSTTISPDGPHGPPEVLKKGVLHIARKSGVPVIPVRFVASRALAFPKWDRALVPLPFSRITAIFGEPVAVTEENLEDAAEIVSARMSKAGSGGQP